MVSSRTAPRRRSRMRQRPRRRTTPPSVACWSPLARLRRRRRPDLRLQHSRLRPLRPPRPLRPLRPPRLPRPPRPLRRLRQFQPRRGRWLLRLQLSQAYRLGRGQMRRRRRRQQRRQ
jgi:hypothetical protein